MTIPASDAIRGEIIRLAHFGLDFHEFARAGVRVLRRAVPFDAVAVMTFDPATALPVDKWIDNSPNGSAGSRLAEIELDEADIEKFRQLAASGRRVARMSDELRAVCVGDAGVWGAILMRRAPGAPNFTTRDMDLLASLSGRHWEVQRVRLERHLSADADDRDPGLLLLDDEDGIELANAAAAGWLDDLRGHRRRLPFVVTAVADRARAIASGDSDSAATARVQAASGRWVLVSGSVLSNGTHARTAVSLEPARAPELAEILANAYGLTARERCVTELVAQGLPTTALAARLHVSTYTIQDHLKAIFEKLDVSSRGELVARLFLDRDQVGGAPERRVSAIGRAS
jgi:DNA-binding NarL/FixJ family response regulator